MQHVQKKCKIEFKCNFTRNSAVKKLNKDKSCPKEGKSRLL